MPDHDLRNPTTGETAIQTVDRMAGNGGKDGGIKGPIVPSAPVPQNIHPSAKGVYGSPVGEPILSGGK